MTTEKARKNERVEHARKNSNAGNATIVGSIPQEKLAQAGSRKASGSPRTVATPVVKAPVRESSPIVSLAMLNAQLSDSVHLLAEALMERETLEAAELEELMTTGHITDKEQDKDELEPKKDDDAVIMQPIESPETAAAAAEAEPEKAEEPSEEKDVEPKLNVTRHE